MKRVYAKHEPYTDGHLGEVAADMEVAGSPTIRVIEHAGVYYALEGSHRLAIAHALGVEPKLVVEIPELDCARDEYWDRVAATLPVYEFNYVHVLKLEEF